MLLPDPEPRDATYLLISVDDHVIEPADMFEGRMPHRIGVENLLLEVDYPHSDGTWPDSQLHTKRLLDGVPDEDVKKITHGNAAALFRHPLPAGR